jgi:hypothetical protein
MYERNEKVFSIKVMALRHFVIMEPMAILGLDYLPQDIGTSVDSRRITALC